MLKWFNSNCKKNSKSFSLFIFICWYIFLCHAGLPSYSFVSGAQIQHFVCPSEALSSLSSYILSAPKQHYPRCRVTFCVHQRSITLAVELHFVCPSAALLLSWCARAKSGEWIHSGMSINFNKTYFYRNSLANKVEMSLFKF